jgi:hypothetical protein
MVYSQVYFYAILGAWLASVAGYLGWCKKRANWHLFYGAQIKTSVIYPLITGKNSCQ